MSKKPKLDLLVRVRFLNPVPPPPFPPKLFSIPTDVYRLGEPTYLSHLAASAPLPMLVDSEMGMPLDLSSFDGVWDGNDQSLNPAPDPARSFDPVDAALLIPFRPETKPNGVEHIPHTAEVSWMRTSNLFTRRANARRRDALGTGDKKKGIVDASEAAQLMSIDKTFSDLHAQDLTALRHPDAKKKNLTVVESYEVLPDVGAWSSSYTVLRLPERPSAATASNPSAGASTQRLSHSVLRPVVENEEQIMEFFLPPEEDLGRIGENYENAVDASRVRELIDLVAENGADPRIDEVLPNVQYDRIRTYDVIAPRQPEKELLIAFQEEENARRTERRKGVYYKEISRVSTLRKTRAKRRGEQDLRSDEWHKVRVGYRIPREDEVEARENVRAKVQDPTWANGQLRQLHGGENALEGQGEAIDDGQ